MAKEEHERRPRRQLLIKLIVALVVVVGVALAGIRIGAELTKEPDPVITSELIGQQLTSVQQLVSVDYHYTNMGKYENRLDFYGWPVPFTSKSFIVSYDGTIKAGVDLSQARASVSEAAKVVTVTLPESKIISHEIPEDTIEVFDENDNLFNHITIDDYTGFAHDQKAAVEQKAIDNGLLTAATEQAREAVETLLRLMPGMDKYTLTVK